MNKKYIFLIGLLVYIIISYFSYSFFAGESSSIFKSPLGDKNKQSKNISSVDIASQDIPGTEECPLNGQLLSKEQRKKWESRRPLGVMIENHVDARPQSGLSDADIIYEAVAEGGITRFLAIYYCKDANFVGPVRSARIYFLKMLQEYGEYPLYVHVGGANCDEETGSGCANGGQADALGQVNKLGWASYNDLNQFSVPFPYYWRDYERLPNRATEHTVYSSTAKLWEYAKNSRKLSNVDGKGKPWDKTFERWKFQKDVPADKRGNLSKINFSFWDSFADQFAVNWMYNSQTNSFKRENGGQPHLDKNDGKQIEAKNVIIVFMDESPANDGYPGGHIIYDTIGSGKALIFQNGQAIKGTWKKDTAETKMKLYDADDNEILMVRGQVFIEILPTGNKVTY